MVARNLRTRLWVTHALAGKTVARVAVALHPDVRVIPVKGVLVGRRFYDDPSERQVSDCDLVVLGASAYDVSRRLVRLGWRVVEWSNDPDVVNMAHPDLPGMHADIHARPLPQGYGAVTAAWLAEGASEDTALFGAPVLIPDDRRLLVHLLGNILRDHVVDAKPHTAVDIARVLARSPFALNDFAQVIRASRLRLGCWAALDSATSRTGDARIAALRDALSLSAWELRYARWRLSIIGGSAGIASRTAARCVSDDPRDAVSGVANAVLGMARAQMLDRWRR